jgi:hypothetical protein
MTIVHTLSLWDIGNALYRAGLLAEYEAIKGYAAERSELLEARISEEASIEAAELVGSNSPEYDGLCERVESRLWDEHYKKTMSSASS